MPVPFLKPGSSFPRNQQAEFSNNMGRLLSLQLSILLHWEALPASSASQSKSL